MKSHWTARALGEAAVKPPASPQRRTLRRVLGEEAHGEEADFHPQDANDLNPPAPNSPGDSDFASMADLEQHQGEEELDRRGLSDPLNAVYNMWRSGSKYDTAEYLLKSNFLYADFVRLIKVLPDAEAVELGTILDELAPPMPEGQEPVDLVSAAIGKSPEGMRPASDTVT